MFAHTPIHIASKIFNLTLDEINTIAHKHSNLTIKFDGEVFIDITKLELYFLSEDIFLTI